MITRQCVEIKRKICEYMCFSKTMVLALYYEIPKTLSELPDIRLCNRSDRLLLQSVSGCKASIFVRKTLQVLPCEIKKL